MQVTEHASAEKGYHVQLHPLPVAPTWSWQYDLLEGGEFSLSLVEEGAPSCAPTGKPPLSSVGSAATRSEGSGTLQ
jgi:hypothetical protein